MIVSSTTSTTYDKEKNITWDDLSPSLQEKFNNLKKTIDDAINIKVILSSKKRITIGPEPPLAPYNSPEPEREIWFDTNENSVKFYMSRNNDGNYAWETTKAAWYGGSKEDVKIESVNPITDQWSLVKTLCWVSNAASNSSYTATTDVRNTDMYTIPKSGTYLFRDLTYLFPYNAGYKYTHDGGRVEIRITRQVGNTSSTIFDNIYDSQSTNCAYNYDTQKYPESVLSLNAGDRIIFQCYSQRNPNSTDDTEIYQTVCVFLYRLNFGSASDSSPSSFLQQSSVIDQCKWLLSDSSYTDDDEEED